MKAAGLNSGQPAFSNGAFSSLFQTRCSVFSKQPATPLPAATEIIDRPNEEGHPARKGIAIPEAVNSQMEAEAQQQRQPYPDNDAIQQCHSKVQPGISRPVNQ